MSAGTDDLNGGLEAGPHDSPWVEWSGGAPPLDPETIVFVRFRGSEKLGLGVEPKRPSKVRFYVWSHSNSGGDIVAYRVVSA